MKQVSLLLLAAVLIARESTGIAQTATNSDEKLRSLIEADIKQGYEKAVSDLAKLPKLKVLTPKEDESTRDFIKGVWYNNAYSLFHCTKVAMQQLSLSATERTDNAATCYQKAQQEALSFVKMTWQYEALIKATNSRKSAACELKARLFDAEFEFPPYDFLKQSDGPDVLYDFAKYSSCLISIVGQ